MKKIILTLILFLVVGLCQVQAEETSYPAEKTIEKSMYPNEINPPHALWRGVLNVATCWLEIPREIILENSKFPLFGIVSGAFRGTFFTSTRAVLSVLDIGLLGFTGPSGYDPDIFPEYVWNSQWNPYSKNVTTDILDQEEQFQVQSISNLREDAKVFSIH